MTALDRVVSTFPEFPDFSLVLGGPLYQFFRKIHLENVQTGMKRRVLIVTGLIWLPLLVLCAIEGTLTRGVDIPFVSDIETHARFLLTVPLMILGELVVHERLRDIIFQFVNRKLVPDNAMETFRAAIRSSMVWRNSMAVEAALAVLVLSA